METQQYKIIQASTQKLLFIKCTCSTYITFVTKNEFVYGQETCYCVTCKKIIKDKKVTYKLALAVLDIEKNKMESIILYDDMASKAIGCPPSQYIEYMKQDKWLSKKLEEQLVGLYCSAITERTRDKGKKAKSFQFLYTDRLKLVDLIRNTANDINFDASIL
ncbi:hypothetical protein PS15m_006037 [Mucor circinelloides]